MDEVSLRWVFAACQVFVATAPPAGTSPPEAAGHAFGGAAWSSLNAELGVTRVGGGYALPECKTL